MTSFMLSVFVEPAHKRFNISTNFSHARIITSSLESSLISPTQPAVSSVLPKMIAETGIEHSVLLLLCMRKHIDDVSAYQL